MRSSALIPITVSYKLTYEQSHYRREAISDLPVQAIQDALRGCERQAPTPDTEETNSCCLS